MRQPSITIHIRHRAKTLVLRRSHIRPRQCSITLRIGHTVIMLGSSWLVIAPLAVWVIATLYVPIMAPSLRPAQAWSVALVTTMLMGVLLVGHALAHTWTARALRSAVPACIPLYPFGDAAQVWPAAVTPQRETLIALAGPAVNLVFAGLAYLLWDLQLHPYLSASMFFVACTNLGLTLFNLAPGFPLDGGRLTRAIVWSLLRRPGLGTRLGIWLGRLLCGALIAWSMILLLQQARFSLATGAGTMFVASVLLLALWRQPAWHWQQPAPPAPRNRAVRGLAASLLLLILLSVGCSMVPTTQGLRTPGFAIAVEPMVSVPHEYRHTYTGHFLLTTVVEQTPILVGQWVYAQVSPASEIVPPERVVPRGVTPQALMKRNYRLLEKSERTAVVKALQLAGYDMLVNGVVVEIISIRPGSWADDVLQPGDRIMRVNGAPLQHAERLFTQLKPQASASMTELEIERAGQLLEVEIPFTPQMEVAERPWLDLSVEMVDYAVAAPFSIKITPQKIIGGPSAGLMFTLTVYNLVTPGDLTGGRRIAGTGTINLDGKVGPIGGVEQKVAAAEAAGAEYFLVPSANYADAQRVARRIAVVRIATVEQAIDFLHSLPPVKAQ
jgi:PDZ domain-containing protein